MKPYDSDGEWFQDELQLLDWRIARLAERRQAEGGEGTPSYLGLAISREMFEQTLAQRLKGSAHQAEEGDAWTRKIRRLSRRMDARLKAGYAVERFPRMVRLAATCGLTPWDLQVLVAAIAPEWDRAYGLMFGYLQDNITRVRPGVDLVLQLLGNTFEERIQIRARLQAGAPLRRFALVDLPEEGEAGGPLLTREIRIDGAVQQWVLGYPGPEPRLMPFCRWHVPRLELGDLLLPSHITEQFAPFFLNQIAERETDPQNSLNLFHLHGPRGAGKAALAEALCAELQWLLLEVDLAKLAALAGQPEHLVPVLVREALLGPALLYFRNWSALEQAPALKHYLADALRDLSIGAFIADESPLQFAEWDPHAWMAVELPIPSFDLRKGHWERALEEADLALDPQDIAGLADRFKFTPGQIRETVAKACRQARLAQHGRVGVSEVYRACRNANRLPELAKKIDPTYTWDDIVLPGETHAQLREICRQAEHRHTVFQAWGFGANMSLGKGLNILFLGPSGTGKTMAAEILANSLRLDLYKVDLSSLISKYIGETEKNLEVIFREAEAGNAVLFFDEADAVFGKRTELKDAHDRYANIEVSYLLQRIEEFEGIVVMASNFHNNLDEAFARRIRYSVEFPFPDPALRRAIWHKVFPAQTPMSDDIDFDFLARHFNLAGGNIRNAALSASFLAVEDGRVSMEHLVRAIKREYQKLGRMWVKSDFGPYFEWGEERDAAPVTGEAS